MARRYILRYDIWICLLIGFLAGLGVERIATGVLSQQYEQHKAEHIVATGEIGGAATSETFRAKNVDDLLSHDTFTVISPRIEYRNKGGGYYGGMYLNALTLPSGEIVAARINSENVTKVNPEDDYFSGDSILPIGRIVYEDLGSSETFLSQIEFKEPLSRHDFYIDMVGDTAIASEADFIEAPALLAQILTIIVVFAILHFIGSKIGLSRLSTLAKRAPKPQNPIGNKLPRNQP